MPVRLNEHTIDKYNLSKEELEITMSYYKPMEVKANQFFLKEGQIANYIGYVTKGILRSFFYDDHANEITTGFFPEGTLIIAFDSFNNRVSSKENIKAIEDAELMVISYQNQKELYERVPAWNKICKELADVTSKEMFERATNFQTLTAADRYNRFCEENKDLLQRVSLGCIASYIGVDIATLSRIRKKI